MSIDSIAPITSGGTVTSFLPMTTQWASIAECSTLFLNPFTNGDRGVFAFDPGYQDVVSAPRCLPPQADTWWHQKSQPGVTTSIGGYTMECPGLYTTAATSDKGASTLIGCCPSGYSFKAWTNAGHPVQCESTLPPDVYTFVNQVSGATSSWTTTSFTLATQSSAYGVHINGYIFSPATSNSSSASTTIVASNAIETFAAASISPGSSTASTATSSTEQISTTIVSSSNANESNVATSSSTPAPVMSASLSQGVKIGIGVSVSFAFVGLATFIAAILLMRRKRDARSASNNSGYFGGGYREPKPFERSGSQAQLEPFPRSPVPEHPGFRSAHEVEARGSEPPQYELPTFPHSRRPAEML